jgi:hypothetical protein
MWRRRGGFARQLTRGSHSPLERRGTVMQKYIYKGSRFLGLLALGLRGWRGWRPRARY